MPPADWSWGETYLSPVFTPPSEPISAMKDASNVFQAEIPPNFTAAKLPQDLANHSQFNEMQTNDPHNQLKTSRKRSRDEMTEGLDEQDSDDSRSSIPAFPSARPTPSPPKQGAGGSRPEPILGPGMTLIYPDDDTSAARGQMDAASQTGTWAEELSERLRSSSMRETTQRPALEARKSLRLDREAAAKMDDVASAVVAADPHVKVGFDSDSTSVTGPTLDEASYTLGIGWRCMPSTPTMAVATRGWALHIEARFPLQSVRFVWMNKSLPAYLVSAVTCDGRERSGSPTQQTGINGQQLPWSNRAGSTGYYLFDEPLSQGRLVASSWERTVENLRASPIAFEGEQVLQSAESANQAQQINSSHQLHATGDSSAGDGMMTDETIDHQPPKLFTGDSYEPKYWAGWGKPSVPALYPQRSFNSCSPFENGSQQPRMAPMIEVGGGPTNVAVGDGMDLDF